MSLVDYSDSDAGSDTSLQPAPGASKRALKRKRWLSPEESSIGARPPASTRDEPTRSPASTRQEPTKTPTALPPLPSSFHDLYASTTRSSTQDDPSLHDGRKRLIPHIEGNWPTHVYLEWYPSRTEERILTTLLHTIQSALPGPTQEAPKLHSLLTSPLSTPLPLHVSLSSPLSLHTAQTKPFLDAISSRITSRSRARPFTVSLTDLRWVPNASSTRWFLVLGLSRPDGDVLNRLLDECNSAARALGQPELYSPSSSLPSREAGPSSPRSYTKNSKSAQPSARHCSPASSTDPTDHSSSFHISIAWTLSEPPGGVSDLQAIAAIAELMDNKVGRIQIVFEAVKVKIGNVVTTVGLEREGEDRVAGYLG